MDAESNSDDASLRMRERADVDRDWQYGVEWVEADAASTCLVDGIGE